MVLPGNRAEAIVWGGPAPRTRTGRRWPAAEPQRPLALHDSWWTVSAAGLLATSILAATLWISVHVRVDAALHTAGLFVHLAALIVGFGGVLVADYLMALWLSGRSTLADAITGMSRLHAPIWVGLTGLVMSGCFLEPDLGSGATRTKMVLILLLTLNGLQATVLSKRLSRETSGTPPTRLLIWGAASGAVSQVCWWGAVGIGFWNAQH
ncbi:hypothetical protein [Nocardia sp. R7R-8]|uniref:hypothetical protein n=1 Tax=Nocardia sp. R7R-8 TaxID=3459304 RepID=UPI00403D9CD3